MTGVAAALSTPRISLHQFTVLASPSVEDVAITVGAGADGLGVSEWKCGTHLDLVGDQLRLAHLNISSYLPTHFSLLPLEVPLQPSPITDARARLVAQLASVERASTLGADLIVVVLGPGDPRRDLPTARAALRELGAVAADHDIAVGVEYLSRTSASVLPAWEEFVHFVAEFDHENLGIVLDVQHVVAVPDLRASSDVWGPRLMLVQLAGVSRCPRGPFDRLLPGQGETALVADFVESVLETGYRGWWEVEILSDDGRLCEALPDSLWRVPPSDLAQTAIREARLTLGASSA